MTRVPFGPIPVRIKCPSCNADITTKVKSEPNKHTHLIALLICVFCLWFCAWVPYCKGSCQNRNHYCPNCDAFIGTYSNN